MRYIYIYRERERVQNKITNTILSCMTNVHSVSKLKFLANQKPKIIIE